MIADNIFSYSLLIIVIAHILNLHEIIYSSLGINSGMSGLIKSGFADISSFLSTIESSFAALFSTIFGSFGSSISIVMTSFGFSAAGYDILGPTMFVGGLGLAFLVGYLFLIPGDAERDVVQGEDEI